MATPVPVLAIDDGQHEVVARLDDGEAVTYAYRQSIYDVAVQEEFVRAGDALDMRLVRSPDIRSIEYFRWDGKIVQREDGTWAEAAPPPSTHPELVIRITALGQQRLFSSAWSIVLRDLFGESVVTVRAGRRPLALVLLRRIG
jgi:hypothetical protein